MSCLFSCFKIKDAALPPPDSQSQLVSQPLPNKDPLVSRNRSTLSSFLIEERDETNTSDCKELENPSLDAPMPSLDAAELRHQAKFLKACGTLPETPVEIRNGSVKYKDLSAGTKEVGPLKFNSWSPDSTFQKLNPNSLPDQATPTKTNGVEKQSGSLVHTPSSCCTDGQSYQSFPRSSINGSGNSDTPIPFEFNANVAHNNNTESAGSQITAPTSQYRYRSIRFEGESDMSSISPNRISSDTSQDAKQSELSGNYKKYSPYPSDEMQTPGTVFPAYLDHMAFAKTARFRSQDVNLVLNPTDNASQLKHMSEEDSYSVQDSNSRLLSNSDQRLGEANQEQSKQHFDSVYGKNIHYSRALGDRPIIGLVATHWNEDETTRVSPKWWDGNGIPNSTNKYKEDQKVSWHATPFEERLEKALSEESIISQRKQLSGMPETVLNETEVSDTAISQKH